MNRLDPGVRRLLLWLVPIVVAAIVLGVELEWGRGVRHAAPPEMPQAPAPVSVGLLPEYAISGGPAALAATSAHPLFNPTRQPAPPAPATVAGGPSQIKRGQFVLTGTAVYGDTAVAYLREVQGGKSRTVKKGEKVNGMLVAEVNSKGIRFTQGGESEELPLKLAAGPKATVQPAAGPTGGPGSAGGGAAQRGGAPLPGTAAAAATAQAGSLAERRRAARAAEAQRQESTPGSNPVDAAAASATGANPNAAATPSPNGQDPHWQQLYQRFRNRNPPSPQ